MKMKFMVTVFLVVLLSSCAKIATYDMVNPPDIIVHVNNNNATITTPGSPKCKIQNQGKNGCVAFEAGQTGLMTFKRTGSPSWSFNTLQICKLLENGEKNCQLNVWERFEFAVTDDQNGSLLVPSETGHVDLTQLSTSLDEFNLLDQNTVAQDYYYRVKLCSGDTCSWADPPIENKGKLGGS